MSHIPSFDEVSNLVDLTTEMENCQRTGCMCAFSRLEDFDNYFMEIMEIFDGSRPSTPDSIHDGESDNDDCGRLSQSVTISNSFTDKGFMANFKQQVSFLIFTCIDEFYFRTTENYLLFVWIR